MIHKNLTDDRATRVSLDLESLQFNERGLVRVCESFFGLGVNLRPEGLELRSLEK